MNRAIRIIATIVIPAAAVAVAAVLIKTRPEPMRSAAAVPPTVVEVVRVKKTRERASVEAMGTVVPAKSVAVFAEVGGRIVQQNPSLVPGGRIKAGEMLVKLDARDYELQVDQQAANVERADFELKMEQSRRAIAEREWKILDLAASETSTEAEGRELALRNPHLKNARASLEAAKSGLQRAKLNVERSIIRAPFSALVMEESVDVGQVVSPATKLATLVGTDEFWVQVSIPVERLGWVSIPGLRGKKEGEGSRARIVHDMGGGLKSERTGRMIRLLGDLDPVGRMARALVSIEEPLAQGDGEPLLLGAYVTVQIEGDELDDVFVVPRTALRPGDEVLTVDAEDRLVPKTVEVVFRRAENVLVRGGFSESDRLIVSRVAAPVAGMKVEVRSSAPKINGSAAAREDRP